MNRQDYEAVYKLGLDMYDRTIGFTEALRLLSHLHYKESVVGDYLYNTTYLLKGKPYTRTLSIAATDDFLTWIRRDRGDEALSNAVKALRGHIKYYEKLRNLRMRGQRRVLDKHTALIKSTGQTAVILEWDDDSSRGYFDILPLYLFNKEGLRKGATHITRRLSGMCHKAKFDLRVGARSAELNYEQYSAFNHANGMLNGVALLRFKDSDRTALESVEWKPVGKKKFIKIPFKCPKYLVPPSGQYEPPIKPGKLVSQKIRERPGQAQFRRNLKSVYSQSCCITGCAVPDALEGAHIDPYKAPASDNLKNGLLLRRDVHALFDKHLISVDPITRKIQIGKAARGPGGYAALDGKLLRKPEDPAHNPDSGALGRHWEAFRKKHSRSSSLG